MMRPCALNTPKGITSMGVSCSNCCPNCSAAFVRACACPALFAAASPPASLYAAAASPTDRASWAALAFVNFRSD
eukprot:scaffold125942_cov48-Phaeocystis_antarctica.AAC.1